MGNLCNGPPPSKPKVKKEKKPLTFGKDPSLNMADFMISHRSGETFVRKSKGQQFLIEECNDCKITVSDKIAALTVDYVKECNIVTGPIESSAFIRNCEDCTFVIACLQFRTRDCKNCTFYLYTSTGEETVLTRG